MSKSGIKSVSYIPLCSTEEIKLEIKKPTGNEIVKKMWDKLDDEEQGFINVMIDRDNKQNEEIERLNNIINELDEYIVIKLKEFNTPEEYYTLKQIDDIYYRLQELKRSDKE